MTSFCQQVERDFQPDAGIARGFPAYIYRDEQVKLAAEIADSFDQGRILLAEAETGIGKTLAYLIPVLRCSEKVLISTHTRALQDQLMHRDIPAIQAALGMRRNIVLLKGRANYLCPHRLDTHLASERLDMWIKRTLLRVRNWAETSRDGDLAGLAFDVFDKGIGGMVTATADQCLGSKCPQWNRCPLVKARQKAQEADVVVTNHSLLLADAALKSGDFGEVLPLFDAYILDEAHSLPALASQHFGIQLTRNRLIQWLNDTQAALDELGDDQALKADINAHGGVLLEAYKQPDLKPVASVWDEIAELIGKRGERNEEMTKLAERAGQIAADLQAVQTPAEGFVAWSEGDGEYRKHIVAPVETGLVLNEHLWDRPASFILLSATLRVSGSFDYAKARLGLEDASESFHPSPFNYAQQALTYLPRQLPPPTLPDGRAALLDEIESLCRASSGRAFVLFTSHAMLRDIAPQLAERLPWTVLEQGRSGSKDAIMQQFQEDTHSVLCGTRSFWEGVDMPGETLSMVIVDKLPFAPPNDPLLSARIKRCEEKGGSGFRDIQLPEAIAVLRQGVGRLIRTVDDRGVMAVLDSRLYTKSYGREVVRNLPPAPISSDLDDVRGFFAADG
ncbi:MAG: ATP-dependent DNA helicase [Mariprofundaceae bacterium]